MISSLRRAAASHRNHSGRPGFGLTPIHHAGDHAAYLNDWVRVRNDRGSLADPDRGRGIEWFFVSLKNTLLIANECLEDRMRGTAMDPMTGMLVLGPPRPAVITDPLRYLRDA